MEKYLSDNGRNFSRKDVWIDYTYAQYKPTKWLSVVGGKFSSPIWQPSDMLISTEINPEGTAVAVNYSISSAVSFLFNGGLFVLSDANGATTGSTSDPLMYVFQPGFKWNITKNTFLRFAPTYYGFSNLARTAVLTPGTTLSSTNTATSAGKYKYGHNTINWGAEFGMNKPFGTSNTISRNHGSSFYKGSTNAMGHRLKAHIGLIKNTSLGLNFYDTWLIRNYSPSSSTTIPSSTRHLSSEETLFQADFILKY
jgi:hypothetical protein